MSGSKLPSYRVKKNNAREYIHRGQANLYLGDFS